MKDPHPTEAELEILVQRELSQLPMRKAPEALAARVMATIAARQQVAWWRQSFSCWPRLAQAALICFLLPFCGLFTWSGWLIGNSSVLPRALGQLLAIGGGLADGLASLNNAAGLVVRNGLHPWLWLGLALSALMYLLCLGAGTVLFRVAYRRL